MSALCVYVSGLIVATPLGLQGGGENSQGDGNIFWLASLAICHPPDQNAEIASEPLLYVTSSYINKIVCIINF